MPPWGSRAAGTPRSHPTLVLLGALAAASVAAAAAAGPAPASPMQDAPAQALPWAAALEGGADPPRRAELYVPSHVRAGVEYYGMVRHEGPRPGGGGAVGARLAADPSSVSIDRAVRLQAGADHAIFAFTALERGRHAIRASVGGEFVEAFVTAHGGGGGPGGLGLEVTLPPSTRSAHVAGAVHLVDGGGGGAAVAASDTAVHLAGSAGVLVPEKAVIPRGSTGAMFDAFVGAPGSVHARSGEMRAEARIGYERTEPASVRVRVWPPVLPENAAGHYFVWFEGPGGGPAKPPPPLAALLHSSDPRIARMDAALPPGGAGTASRPLAVQLTGAPWHGTFRTGGAGAASLTAAVPGHGSDTDWFVVGPAAYGAPEPVLDNGTVGRGAPAGRPAAYGAPGHAGSGAWPRAAAAAESAPNIVISDVVPPVAAAAGAAAGPGPGPGAGHSYVVAAAYRAAYSDRTVEVGGGAGGFGTGSAAGDGAGRVEMSGAVSSLRPSVYGPVEIVIASDGADHAATAVLGAPVLDGGAGPARSNSAVVPIRADAGRYAVSVTAPGMRPHPESVQFMAVADGAEGGGARLYLLPLPVVPGRMQDVALAYVGDESGAVLDPSKALGSGAGGRPPGAPAIMLEAGAGAALPAGFVTMDAPVVRIRGSPGPDGGGSLSAWAPPALPAAARLGAQWAGPGPGGGAGPGPGPGPGSVDAPAAVRMHEVFPASILLPTASADAEAEAGKTYAAGAAKGGGGLGAPQIDASGGCRRASAAEASAALAASRGGLAGGGDGKEEGEGAKGDDRDGGDEGGRMPGGAAAAAAGSGLFVCSLAGRLSAFSDAGHSSAYVEPYARDEGALIEAGFGGGVRAGGEYRIDVRLPAAPPAAPPAAVAVDTAVPHEIVDGGRGIVLRPDRAGTFAVTVAADAPGGAPSSARFDVDVDASISYSVRALDASGADLAVPVTIASSAGGQARAAVTPHVERAEEGRGATVGFPRSVLHGDRAYELVAAGFEPAHGGGAPGSAPAGSVDAGAPAPAASPSAPTAVTAAPRDGDVFSATYARVVLVQVAGGAEGGGAFREGRAVAVSAPEVHVASFLVRQVWDRWDVRPAGQAAEPGRAAAAAVLSESLNRQGPAAEFAAAEDVVVTAVYREDHTGAAAAFAAAGMIAVLAVFRGGAAYTLRAVQALDAAEAAWRGLLAAVSGALLRGRAGRRAGAGEDPGPFGGADADDPDAAAAAAASLGCGAPGAGSGEGCDGYGGAEWPPVRPGAHGDQGGGCDDDGDGRGGCDDDGDGRAGCDDGTMAGAGNDPACRADADGLGAGPPPNAGAAAAAAAAATVGVAHPPAPAADAADEAAADAADEAAADAVAEAASHSCTPAKARRAAAALSGGGGADPDGAAAPGQGGGS